MPTNRVLYSIADIIQLLAEKHGVGISNVDTYENMPIQVTDLNETYECTDCNYLFQMDIENG